VIVLVNEKGKGQLEHFLLQNVQFLLPFLVDKILTLSYNNYLRKMRNA
jgi:hypothetical protein